MSLRVGVCCDVRYAGASNYTDVTGNIIRFCHRYKVAGIFSEGQFEGIYRMKTVVANVPERQSLEPMITYANTDIKAVAKYYKK